MSKATVGYKDPTHRLNPSPPQEVHCTISSVRACAHAQSRNIQKRDGTSLPTGHLTSNLARGVGGQEPAVSSGGKEQCWEFQSIQKDAAFLYQFWCILS